MEIQIIEAEEQAAEIRKRITKKDYTKIKVTSEAKLEEALNARVVIGEAAKQIATAKKSILNPLNMAIKNARALFAPLEAKVMEQDRYLYDQITKWRFVQEEKIAAKMKKVEGDIKSGKITITQAGQRIEKAEEKITKIPARKVEKLRILDISKIPAQYLLPNEPAIKAALRRGENIPGAELYTEEITLRK